MMINYLLSIIKSCKDFFKPKNENNMEDLPEPLYFIPKEMGKKLGEIAEHEKRDLAKKKKNQPKNKGH